MTIEECVATKCSACGLASSYIGLTTYVETRRVLCDRCRSYELEQQQRDVENILTLRVGTPVYRAQFDRIERGDVCYVGRCDLYANGDPMRNDVSGKYLYFAARFRSEWVGQTFQWKWFADITKAREKLVQQLREQISNHQRNIARAEALIASVSTLEAV